mmetsp:Transcript_12233/g.18521  ORF Transcript_12233/g.18521 Transcript_12233/m.18521 type:complete len:865 (+) Transcript_12233:98-2692(+)
MTTLPREVLRWIQSLDLAYSVKNVKRDFSNGFLIAEIFSRYYAKDVHMHSYDNGTALKVKRDNWNQLQKFFRKIGIPDVVSDDEVGKVIRCEDGAAITVVTRIYETLTQRKVQVTVKKPTVGKVSGYAKETGSWKVRETLRKSDFVDDSDLNTVSRVAREAAEEHEKEIHEGRSLDPDRFASISIAASSSQMVPKAAATDVVENTPHIRVKEIQVKQLDRNVTHLRASKQMQGGGGVGSPANRGPRAVTPAGAGGGLDDSTSQVSDHQSQSAVSMGGVAAVGPGMMLPENAVSLLNSCISRIMGPQNIPNWNVGIEPLQNFMSVLEVSRSGGIGRVGTAAAEIDDLIYQVLSEVRMSAQQLAEACVVTPKQFWKVSDLLTSAINSCSYQSPAYAAAVEGFESVGRWTFQRDPKSSLPLFCDFGLFKLARTLNEHPYKRLGVLRVLYAFSPHDTMSHVQCIKRLQAIVPDLRVFICCLTILATLETDLDMSLLDLYQYYATIGLGLPSPRIRAGAAAVMSALYPLAGGMISPMLPQLRTLARTESWWEMHAHLLSLSAAVLEAAMPPGGEELDPATEDPDQAEKAVSVDEECALSILTDLFTVKSSKTVREWGLVVLARTTGYSDKVSMMYLNVVQSICTESRRFLLDLDEGKDEVKRISLPSSTGVDFVLEPIAQRLSPLCMARAIESKVIAEKLEQLDEGLMQMLYACVRGAAQSGSIMSIHKQGSTASCESEIFETTLNGSWVELYTSLKDFILVGLCNPSCTEDAAGILVEYVLKSPTQEGVITDNKFLSTLKLLYPADGSGNGVCQSATEAFFEHLFNCGDFYAAAVVNTIEVFAKNYTTNYEMSNLPTLMKAFLSHNRK